MSGKCLKGGTHFIQFKCEIKSYLCTRYTVISTTSYLCQQDGQVSVLFLRGTRRQAADKPILIEEPAWARGLKDLPAGVAPPSAASPGAHEAHAEAKRPSRTALLARHAVRATSQSPAASPSLTSRSPPSHLQASSTAALLQMDVAVSCRLSRMTCHPVPSQPGSISSSLLSARQHWAAALQDLPCPASSLSQTRHRQGPQPSATHPTKK